MENESPVERCPEHRCCIRVPWVEAAPGFSHLAGEWHLRWIPDDRTWFLVPPRGNVWEIRVMDGADPAGELVVEGMQFDDIRRAIDRESLSPPC